jgi:tRNA (adenine22-N1)-methyltransferase
MELSKRLQALVDFVPQGAKVADIGTDHGYIPINLVENAKANFVVGVDVNKGPLQSAERAVREAGLGDKINLRLGDGLQVIKPGEVDTLIIAGMGGPTMIEIFEESPEVLAKTTRLILQPMIASATLREWLVKQNWEIIDEELVFEEGRIYEIILCEPLTKLEGSNLVDKYSIGQLEIGPKLLERDHPLLSKHAERVRNTYNNIIKEVSKSNSEEAQVKLKELEYKLSEIKKVLPWD